MLLELWAVPIDTDSCTKEGVLDLARKHLPVSAVARLERFANPEDAYRSLIGRLLPRAFLHTHNLLHQATFFDDQQGRPACQFSDLTLTAKAFDFNISHDGHWVAAAFALSLNSGEPVHVGVDVMRFSMPWKGPVNQLYEAMQTLMSDEEQEAYHVLGEEEDQLRHLISLWTHKEAFSKCQRAGLRLNLAEYSVSLPTSIRAPSISHLGQDLDMHWSNCELGPDYLVCGVSSSKQVPWAFKHVSAHSLIERLKHRGV